jgi:uncharacterized repeat protein (TIGR03843 family)
VPKLQPVNLTLQQALEHGEISVQGQFVLGSNYTFLVSIKHEGSEFRAVYKPQKGEQPLWDFPAASLAGREVAAYLLSQALGWDLVPLTVLREGPFGPGSLQQFIEYNPNRHYFTFKLGEIDCLRPVALFDLLINNADRKGSHVLLQKRTRHLYAIDHGLCFHAEDKLRTVIWDFAGEPFPEELLHDLEALSGNFDAAAAKLAAYLNPGEIEALARRLDRLLKDPFFPFPPDDRRSFPYPPL